MTKSNIESEIIANLPYGTDEPGYRMRLAKLFLVEDFRNGTHLPLRRPLKDCADKLVRMVISRERRLGIEVDSTPFPALRYDPGHARTEACIGVDARQ